MLRMEQIDSELLKTLHTHSDELPYVSFQPGIETRVLQVRREENLVVNQIRVQPGVISGLHRHVQPVYGWTVRGAWGHDSQHLYRPGTYIYETAGVVHRFHNGNQITEAVFVSTGDVERIDSDTLEVTSRDTPARWLDAYLERCEGLGYTSVPVLR